MFLTSLSAMAALAAMGHVSDSNPVLILRPRGSYTEAALPDFRRFHFTPRRWPGPRISMAQQKRASTKKRNVRRHKARK